MLNQWRVYKYFFFFLKKVVHLFEKDCCDHTKNIFFEFFFKIIPLREKCPYSELFWSVFSRIWTEYGEIRSISLYSVRTRKNTNQNHPEYGPFLCSGSFRSFLDKIIFSLSLRQIFAIHHQEILNLLKKRKNIVIKCIYLIICQINLK